MGMTSRVTQHRQKVTSLALLHTALSCDVSLL